MDQIDLGQDMEPVERLEGEIDTLMRRLMEIDAHAVTRLEKLLAKLRIERACERHLN